MNREILVHLYCRHYECEVWEDERRGPLKHKGVCIHTITTPWLRCLFTR